MLTSSLDPATAGRALRLPRMWWLRASIAAPTGVVTFLDGSTVLGTKTLVGSGVASFSTAALGVGSHAITASYAGDSGSAASVSAVLTETVNGTAPARSGFSVSVTGAATVPVGGVASLPVAVAPQTGYMQPVQLSCARSAFGGNLQFAAKTIPAGGGDDVSV